MKSISSHQREDLARRGSDPRDRRRNPITITEKGMELVTTVPLIAHEDLTSQALQSFGIEPTIQLRELLRRLITEFPEGKMVAEMISGQTGRP